MKFSNILVLLVLTSLFWRIDASLAGGISCLTPPDQEEFEIYHVNPIDVSSCSMNQDSCGVLECSEGYEGPGPELFCDNGSWFFSGDACTPKTCAVDEYVSSGSCLACPAGTTNEAGDRVIDADSSCDPILCAVDEYVSSNSCVACPAGTTNLAGDDASGADTSCDVSTGKLAIQKVNYGGPPGDVFTADILNIEQDIPFSAEASASILGLEVGTYTVSEDFAFGYAYRGFTVGGSNTCSGTPDVNDPSGNVTITADTATFLCFYNEKIDPCPGSDDETCSFQDSFE